LIRDDEYGVFGTLTNPNITPKFKGSNVKDEFEENTKCSVDLSKDTLTGVLIIRALIASFNW
jgi:hypothetical protein